jgi:hypothetical protein
MLVVAAWTMHATIFPPTTNSILAFGAMQFHAIHDNEPAIPVACLGANQLTTICLHRASRSRVENIQADNVRAH